MEIRHHTKHQKTHGSFMVSEQGLGSGPHPVGAEGVVMVSKELREEEFVQTLFFCGRRDLPVWLEPWSGGQGGPWSRELGRGVVFSSSVGKGGGSSSGLM